MLTQLGRVTESWPSLMSTTFARSSCPFTLTLSLSSSAAPCPERGPIPHHPILPHPILKVPSFCSLSTPPHSPWTLRLDYRARARVVCLSNEGGLFVSHRPRSLWCGAKLCRRCRLGTYRSYPIFRPSRPGSPSFAFWTFQKVPGSPHDFPPDSFLYGNRHLF